MSRGVDVSITRPSLFKGQREVMAAYAKYRFLVLNCGRRWGKDYFLSRLIIDSLLEGKVIGLWSPEVQMSMQVFWLVLQHINPIVKSKNSAHGKMSTVNGGVFETWHTKENTQGRGRKYHLAIVNEVAFAKDDFYSKLWFDTIRPTLSTKGQEGKAVFSSSPFGSNHFEQMAELGKSSEHPDWCYFHFKSVDSPYVSQEEVDAAQKELPPAIFARNYLATFERSNELQLIERAELRACVITDYAEMRIRLIEDSNKLEGYSNIIYIGVDFCGDMVYGETKDYNALVFRKDNVVFDYELNKKPMDDFCDYIVKRTLDMPSGSLIYLIVDHIGVGSGTIRMLKKKLAKYEQDMSSTVIVKPFSNKIMYGISNGVLDSTIYKNHTARIYWLLRRAIKQQLLVIIKNKYYEEFETQFVNVEYDVISYKQDSVIDIQKKGQSGMSKSPDLPDALKQCCTSVFLKDLLKVVMGAGEQEETGQLENESIKDSVLSELKSIGVI